MVSTAQTEVNLFGKELPSFEELKSFSAYVNSSESNKIALAEEIAQQSGNPLACGIGLFILGQNEQAIEKLQKGADCKEGLMYLGHACAKTGDVDNAIKNFDKAAKKQADSLMVTLAKADALRQAGQLDKCEKELSTCGNFEKVSAEYHYQLGRLKDAQGTYEDAMSDYETAIELDSGHQYALFHLAYACDLRGDDDAAVDYYKQIMKNSPVYLNAMLNLAVLHEDRNDYEKAANCVYAVLRVHPNHKKAILFKKDIESSMVMVHDEEKERRLDIHNQILEIPISDFELSVRSRNCLKKMNIITIGDLLRITESRLLSYKNFGETSLMEVKKILDTKGLTIGMALENDAMEAYGDFSESENPGEEVMKKPVEDLGLSVRAKRALAKLDLNKIGELVSKTEAELLGCKNFGVTSLNEIKDRLAAYDLSLRILD